MLDEFHILTAAHCLFDSGGKLNFEYMLFAVAGQTTNESFFPSSLLTVRAAKFFIHPDFQDTASSFWANDIAIIRLDSSLNPQSTVVLPIDESYRLGSDGIDNNNNDNIFEAVGHGNTRSGSDDTNLLQSAQVSYVTNSTCENGLPALSNKQICFKGISTVPEPDLTSGTCQGDSGGPVYFNDSGFLIQVGITSFGPTTCGDGFRGSYVTSVFTEIVDYRGWIDDVLSGNAVATFVSNDDKRLAFLNGTFESDVTADFGVAVKSDVSNDDDGGGGALGIWLIVALGVIALWRRCDIRVLTA